MKKFFICAAALAAVCTAVPAFAANFEIHGDLNNRFGLYTNQAQMFHGTESVAKTPLDKDDIEEAFADLKYRFETIASTNDGNVKGVFAIEIGGQQYGGGSTTDFSGDGVDIEVRKAYTDFQLPGFTSKARVSIGQQVWSVNPFVWKETAPSVQLKADAGAFDLTLGWARGFEVYNNDSNNDLLQDLDSFFVRGDFKPADSTELGVFALYERQDNLSSGADSATSYLVKNFGDEAQFDLYTLGVDGSYSTPTESGNLFANWDLIYQGGEIGNDLAQDLDVNAWLAHADVGANFGKTRLTYTSWYASGDDDSSDDEANNFMSTDVDRSDSVIFFEGGYTDDDYFTEAPYVLDKGLFLNRLAVDHKYSDKTKVGAAILYVQTAEDLTLKDGSEESTLGTELDAYVSHMLYPNLEVALNAGYLFADSGMDYFEAPAFQDGSSDTDVFRTTMRVRYKF
jgi:hypothetical protein